MPVYLTKVAPELNVHSIGQGEDGQAPAGVYTKTLNTAPVPDRGDPCAAFRS